MLVTKGGISRNIDETRLYEYKAKGYTLADMDAVDDFTEPPTGGIGEKPVNRMNTAELTQKAAVLGVDISAATNNKQRADAIQAYLADMAKE